MNMINKYLKKDQGSHCQLRKKNGKHGNFFVKNMIGLWDFPTKIWEEYGKNEGSSDQS